ncbi:MAG: hypothetical protein ACE5JU_22535, partial [Candidatus Binatia bacterium]
SSGAARDRKWEVYMEYDQDKHLATIHALSAYREACIAWHRDPCPQTISAMHGAKDLLESYLKHTYAKENRAPKA